MSFLIELFFERQGVRNTRMYVLVVINAVLDVAIEPVGAQTFKPITIFLFKIPKIHARLKRVCSEFMPQLCDRIQTTLFFVKRSVVRVARTLNLILRAIRTTRGLQRRRV
jgi:hypothetical protein